MKIILSRKGFDAENGGIPSPILPCGRAYSLPIPVMNSPTRMKEIKLEGYDLEKIISDLSGSNELLDRFVHLDPDIERHALSQRPEKWRGAFGQAGSAQSHLRKQNVTSGDLFLFFGWFKEIYFDEGRWKFKEDAADLHVIYGWLAIDKIIPINNREERIRELFPWLATHPHLHDIKDKRNTIYIGKKRLPPHIHEKMPGYGTFGEVRECHILTDRSQSKRSVWRLPISFLPKDGKKTLELSR